MKKRKYSEDIQLRDGSISGKIVFSIVFVLFTLYAFILIYPLLWGIFSSIKTPKAYFAGTISKYMEKGFSFKSAFNVKNYIEAFGKIKNEDQTFLDMIWNSVWFAGGSAFISIEFMTIFSYVINKYKFKGRNFLYGLGLFMVSVPIGATFVSTYRLMYQLRIVDSYLILITATNVYGMNFLLMQSFWGGVSWSYAEAAQIDGAGFYTIYFKVMRSQAMPMMITMFLLAFIAKWNDYMSPLLYLPHMLTLSTGLYKYQLVVERTGNYPVLFSGLIISITPIFVIFAIFNKKLLGNFSIGGLKG